MSRYGVAIAQLAACCLIGALLGWWLSPRGEAPDPAPAPSSPGFYVQDPWLEPYGGCDEAHLYPATEGWWECVAHGLEVMP